MTISPTPNNNKNYLVKDGKITYAGWQFLKQFNKNVNVTSNDKNN